MRCRFLQEYKFGDKDSHELWNSTHMECRPFKDPNFDLRRAELDIAIQVRRATGRAAPDPPAVCSSRRL